MTRRAFTQLFIFTLAALSLGLSASPQLLAESGEELLAEDGRQIFIN